MDDRQYYFYADDLFEKIKLYIDELDEDYDCQCSGKALIIERFGENDEKNRIIVNLQPFKQEIWLAGRNDAFHFRYINGGWFDIRDAGGFFEKFAVCLKIIRA